MSTAGSASGASAARDVGRREGRQVALHVDDDVRAALPDRRSASASKMRSEPEAWSARVMTARPPAFSTQAAIASESVATTTGPMPAASRAPQHVHDHRLAGDVGERLAGQPGRGHAGRDEDQDVARPFDAIIRSGRGRFACMPRSRSPRCAKYRGLRLYGLPGARQTGYLCAAVRLLAASRHLPGPCVPLIVSGARMRWTPSK